MPRMSMDLVPPLMTKPAIRVCAPLPAVVRTERFVRRPEIALVTVMTAGVEVAVGPELLVTVTVYVPELEVCAFARV